MAHLRFRISAVLVLPLLLVSTFFGQQATGNLRGVVADPTGAIIPGASIVISGNGKSLSTTSGGTGFYHFNGLPAGQYTIDTSIEGFTPFESKGVVIAPGTTKTLNIAMTIAAQTQQVHVSGETSTIDTTPESNANAMVIKGKDLDALSDDPDELSSELQALAGPSAGPNGGEIYIDGFSGGQIPPKSSIREIIVNQNPFSAEFDRLGYGRIEILTKAGTGEMHSHIFSRGNFSGLNAQNPILNSNLPPGAPRLTEPPYYSYFFYGNIGGPMTKTSSYFADFFNRRNESVSIIDAIDPASVTPSNPNGTYLNETVSSPSTRYDTEPRFDFQLGQANTLTLRYEYYHAAFTNGNVGELSLPEQATNGHNEENTLQASDSIVMSKNFVDNIRFRYRRIRNNQSAQYTIPSVTVSGAFTDGGSNSGSVRDNQDDYEVQDYFTGSKGRHALNFGGRLRAYRDANYSNAGTNGSYTFTSLNSYLLKTPQQYKVTVVNNNQYTARAIPYDLALFYQDDFAINRKFTFSYGLRWETQNEIHDKSDFAPRIYLAYALGHGKGKPKTVVRAGYGWFYQRFTVPNGSYGTPYILPTLRNNLPSTPGGVSNQQIYVVQNPTGYTETSPGNPVKPPNPTTSTSAPTYWTLAPNFHASLDMQAAIGVDRQIAKGITGNVTYLYSRGVHDYLSNNTSAPFFDGSTNMYPATPLAPPSENINQLQSGGVYREQQIIATANARLKRFSVFSFYTYSNAKSDTSGFDSFSMNAHDPGQDYGRTDFAVTNRFLILGDVNLPYQVSFAPFFVYNSGTPYNITTGSDLTANNQFNARPAYAPASDCPAGVTSTRYYSTKFGCLDANPFGTNEKILPYNVGTGPSNYSLNLRVAKVIGFGPKLKTAKGGNGFHGGGHGLGGRGLSGNQGGPGQLDAAVARKYSLTLSVFAQNVMNRQNLAPPNGTLGGPFFGKSTALAGGFFGPSTAGNRSIFLNAGLNF
ncbi:MAG: carboxypeptidase-like regulatory domain-containing protein [Bryobacteraceae bacterium]